VPRDSVLRLLRYHARIMAKRHTSDILRWAHLGAAARLKELDDERAAIVKAFPALNSASARATRARNVKTSDHDAPLLPRKRRTMSAAARKRISDAQKKRWAAQRASKG
jgi:hypothetical protein